MNKGKKTPDNRAMEDQVTSEINASNDFNLCDDFVQLQLEQSRFITNIIHKTFKNNTFLPDIESMVQDGMLNHASQSSKSSNEISKHRKSVSEDVNSNREEDSNSDDQINKVGVEKESANPRLIQNKGDTSLNDLIKFQRQQDVLLPHVTKDLIKHLPESICTEFIQNLKENVILLSSSKKCENPSKTICKNLFSEDKNETENKIIN